MCFSDDVYLRETENGDRLLGNASNHSSNSPAPEPLSLARMPHRRFPNYLHGRMQVPDQSCPFDADVSAPFPTGRRHGRYRASRASRV